MDIDKLFDRINEELYRESNKLYKGYSPKPGAMPCSIDGCKNTIYASGLCNAHYIRKNKGRKMDSPIRHIWRDENQKTCTICGSITGSKGGWGLCSSHYNKRRREIIRNVCIEEMGGKCKKCKGIFPAYVYDFHHRDPGEKEDTFGSYISSWSIKRVAKEVAKCDLLCANCHRLEHHERKLC